MDLWHKTGDTMEARSKTAPSLFLQNKKYLFKFTMIFELSCHKTLVKTQFSSAQLSIDKVYYCAVTKEFP